MGKTKIIGTTETEIMILNKDTGEINTDVIHTKTLYKTVSTEEFMLVYINDLSGMFQLENKTEIKLMALIWKDCEFNDSNTNLGNIVYALKQNKEKWAEEINCSLSRINNTITSLSKKGLLIQESRGVYIVNPKFFFKGFTKDRMKVMQTIIEYKII